MTVDDLAGELRKLHLRAGAPSSRAITMTIAENGGRLSHTAVNNVLKGEGIPKWETLELIVDSLKGDKSKFQALWHELKARSEDSGDSPKAVSPKPVSNRNATGDVSVFVSYSHRDDDSTHGRVRNIAGDIASTYGSITGLDVSIFFDTDSIALGEDWRKRIISGLDSATVLLAFISPAYLRSSACREELTSYYSSLPTIEGKRLLIPVLLFDTERMDRYFGGDELWRKIQELQWFDASLLRIEQPGSPAWMVGITTIAERVEDALAAAGSSATYDEPLGAAVVPVEDDAVLEVIARAEEDLPKIADWTYAYMGSMYEFTRIITEATVPMKKADTFGKRLAISNNLGQELRPVVDECLANSRKLLESVESVSPGIVSIIRLIEHGEEQGESNVIEFFRVVREAESSIMTASDATAELIKEINKVRGMSKRLDQSIQDMRQSLLVFTEVRGYAKSWTDEISRVVGASS